MAEWVMQRRTVYHDAASEQVAGNPLVPKSETRQQILILHLAEPDLGAGTVAWALYDGARPAGDRQMQAGDQPIPPYASVVDAMHDGWRVLQLPQLPTYPEGAEHETGPLPWEYVLERFVRAEAADDH